MPESVLTTRPRLVIVTGSGRSGTSSVAGALKRLGMYVPQPEIPPDETNPRGFYEPAWVVEFHKRLLNSVPARTNDARPLTAAEVEEAASAPEVRNQLTTWLAEQVAEVGQGGQILVKDPRAFWLHDLWGRVTDDLGIDVSYLTMLRHPAEVVQSRETHYLSQQTEEVRGIRQTSNLAGWVNSAYQTEVATRSRPRCFLRYVDLLADWRSAMTQVQRQLGLTYNADLSTRDHHGVDDFIDTTLRRAKVTWEEVTTLSELRDLCIASWEACNALVESPYDETAIATLARVQQEYVVLHQYAIGMTLDHTNMSVVRERREIHARLKAEHGQAIKTLKERLARRRMQVGRLEKQLDEVQGAGARDPSKG